MQVHALARLLVPDRRIVRRTNQLAPGNFAEIPVELDRLVRVERVDASTAPLWQGVGPGGCDAIPEVEDGVLQTADVPEVEESALEERRSILRRQPASDRGGGQTIVERALEHELDESLEVEPIRGHAEHDLGR